MRTNTIPIQTELVLIGGGHANIQVLKRENFVQTVGNIYQPGIVSYNKRNSVKDYISMSGGLKQNTLKRKIYVQSKNGKVTTMNPVKIRFYRPNPGDKIIVPVNDKPRDFDFTTFIRVFVPNVSNKHFGPLNAFADSGGGIYFPEIGSTAGSPFEWFCKPSTMREWTASVIG